MDSRIHNVVYFILATSVLVPIRARNITVLLRNNFEMDCDSRNPVNPGPTGLIFKKFNVTIYDTAGDGRINHLKYGVELIGTVYMFTVKTAVFNDAAIYTCVAQTDGSIVNSFNVVVIENTRLLSYGSFMEGEELRSICRVRIMNPTPQHCSEDHISQSAWCPRLTYTYEETVVSNFTYRTESNKADGRTQSVYNVAHTTTPSRQDHGKQRSCSVLAPGFNFHITSPLVVKYPVSLPEVVPRRDLYVVGQYITCNSSGNPNPKYTWTNLESKQDIHCQKLHITPGMKGRNSWACFAENEPGIELVVKETDITFEVVDSFPGEVHRWKSLSIGLLTAFVISSVLVILCIVFLLYKRRKRKVHGSITEMETFDTS